MHHKEIKYNPERISKIRPFINNLDWDDINFPPPEQDYKTLEMNNKSIALSVLHTQSDGKISHLYRSEFNKTREKQVILLMITDGQKQHYLAVKRLNALLKEKTGHSGDYCLDCFKLFRNKSSFQKHTC